MRRIVAALSALSLAACAAGDSDQPADGDGSPKPFVELTHPEWSKDAILYQINTRQFTPEGTFVAAQKELPRLKELGVDILWLMPIHPIGEENRKGTLGSPYSVKDYYGVNPEFGTPGELKAFIDAAHEQGFKVILDWVANHTAWDHPLRSEHPDWYEKSWDGSFRPTPWWDWSDIIDLDWSKQGVWDHVGDAMEMWVRDYDVDGFRTDVAKYVPVRFWEEIRPRLERHRPVFMLGETDYLIAHRAGFDATYAWDWHHASKRIAKGEADATAFYGYYSENESVFPREAMRMTYIENHDSNAWEGTMEENYGPALEAMTALSFTTEGLPLIHNGMEVCNAKRLEFFEKDPIDWSQGENCDYGNLLQRLIAFRDANPALHNGQWGARMHKVENSAPQQLFSWVREQDGNKVLGLFNMSGSPVTASFSDGLPHGTYTDFASGEPATITDGGSVTLAPWGYRLLASGSGT